MRAASAAASVFLAGFAATPVVAAPVGRWVEAGELAVDKVCLPAARRERLFEREFVADLAPDGFTPALSGDLEAKVFPPLPAGAEGQRGMLILKRPGIVAPIIVNGRWCTVSLGGAPRPTELHRRLAARFAASGWRPFTDTARLEPKQTVERRAYAKPGDRPDLLAVLEVMLRGVPAEPWVELTVYSIRAPEALPP